MDIDLIAKHNLSAATVGKIEDNEAMEMRRSIAAVTSSHKRITLTAAMQSNLDACRQLLNDERQGNMSNQFVVGYALEMLFESLRP